MGSRRFLEIPSLDGMRAVSIAIVFASHAGLEDRVPGGLGVTIFFVLSGYLITSLLRLEVERTGALSLRRFYVRRAFRIWPLFYTVLLLAVVASWFGLGTGRVQVSAVAAQAGHIANYWGVLRTGVEFIQGTGVYWSLAIEEHFYLVFPLVFLVLGRAGVSYRRQAAGFLAVCVAVLVWRYVLVYGLDAETVRTYYATDTRIDSLLLGCAAAVVANPVIDGTRQSRRTLTALAATGALVILASIVYRDDGFRETLRYTVQSVAIVAILRYVVAVPDGLVGRLLNIRLMRWLGGLSYALYLVHHIVILEVQKHTRSVVLVAAMSVSIAVPLAWALQQLVERPAHRLRERVLSGERRPAIATAEAATATATADATA